MPSPQNPGEAIVADHPTAVITNGLIRATLFLPDAERGFYRSTRFDWSGMIGALEFGQHQFYGPWFTASDPTVRDFVYRDEDIVVSSQSGALGPAEEFPVPQGYDRAAAGGTFIKVGVGVLRKPDAEAYSAFSPFDIVDTGRWEVETAADAVTFVQVVTDPDSGYGYEYRKTVSLAPDEPNMVISHRLRNTGRLAIETTQYNHNFLTSGGATTGPAFRIVLPFVIQTPRPPDANLATIDGNTIAYTRPLVDRERVSFPIDGFGPAASDYDVRVENQETGAGLRIRSDRPMVRAMLWSIRSVISVEPFIDVSTAPGATTEWTYTYTFYDTH
jgi:hypothetical protein